MTFSTRANPESDPESDERPAYLELLERAARLLNGAPGGLDADTLARALFGTRSSGPWAKLLPRVLGADPRFVRAGDTWRLAAGHSSSTTISASDVRAPGGGFAVVALATTGADPHRHRLVRLAMVRVADDGATTRLDLLLNPGVRVADYLLAALGISRDALDDAPRFAETWPSIQELLDQEALFAYGARRVAAFLDAERRRAGHPPLGKRILEIDHLLHASVPAGQKAGLAAAATEHGMVRTRAGSLLAEAEVAARLVERLRHRPLLDTLPRQTASAVAGSGPFLFTRTWLASIPEAPGLYLMRDAAGTVLYVGKAAQLRQRLAAYVNRAPSLHRDLEALAVRTEAVETIEMASDLEATLLEARLIQEHFPPFNVARRAHRSATVVRIAPHATPPSVRLVEAAVEDGAVHFGPYESARAAQRALGVARSAFPEAFQRCSLELPRQRQAVLEVGRLLAGQTTPAIRALQGHMRDATAAGDRRRVDRLRAALGEVRGLDLRASVLLGRPPDAALVILERLSDERSTRAHLVAGGRLIGSVDVDTSMPGFGAAEAAALARTLRQRATAAAAGTASEQVLILRWLAQARKRATVIPLPEHMD